MKEIELSVLLPAWNEGGNLPGLAEALLSFPNVKELIVIDDASSDGTESLWRQSAVSGDPRVRFQRNPLRLGLACSVLQALRWAKSEYVLVRDSDWNHDVADIPALISAASAGHDLVVASRYAQGAPAIGRWNDLLSWGLNRSLGSNPISDWSYGYFLARRSLLLAAPQGWVFRGRGEYVLRLFRWILAHRPEVKVTELLTKVQSRGAGQSSTRAIQHGLAYLDSHWAKQPSPDRGELEKALGQWKKKGEGAAACGHTRPGLRSRCALLAPEKPNISGPVLDLGCGNGAFTRELGLDQGLQIDGVERDADFVRAIKPGLYRQVFSRDLRLGLPSELATRRYRSILCFELLQYLDWTDVLRLFLEVRALAEPGARLLCLFPHRPSLWHRVRRTLGLGREDYRVVHDLSLIVAAAQEAGWRPERALGCGYGRTALSELASFQQISPDIAHLLVSFEA